MKYLSLCFSLLVLSLLPAIAGSTESADETRAREHREAAMSFLHLNGWAHTINQQGALQKDLAQQVSQASGLAGEHQQRLSREIAAGLDEIWQKVDWVAIEKEMLGIVKSTYSLKELRDLNAFFSSPAGEKYLAENNRLEESTIVLVNQELAKYQPLLQERILKALEHSDEEASCCAIPH